MKIVINDKYGGFGLSRKGIKRYLELKGKECYFYTQTKYNYKDGIDEYTKIDENDKGMFIGCVTKDLGEKTNELPDKFYFSDSGIPRDDLDLIKVIEELGSEANGKYASLKIIEIPDNIKWYINEYDGNETVEEEHRSWS